MTNTLIENKYEKDRTKLGNVLYNITFFFANGLIKHPVLFYILSYTWGIVTTILGWIVYIFVRIFFASHIVKHRRFGHCHYLMLFKNWGGLELGTNFLIAADMGDSWTYRTKCHELGHTIQNAIWGPFALLFIFIPSTIRYWVRRAKEKKVVMLKPYDTFWPEESATNIGLVYHEYNSSKFFKKSEEKFKKEHNLK